MVARVYALRARELAGGRECRALDQQKAVCPSNASGPRSTARMRGTMNDRLRPRRVFERQANVPSVHRTASANVTSAAASFCTDSQSLHREKRAVSVSEVSRRQRRRRRLFKKAVQCASRSGMAS
jgi:hypothetical protein